MTIRDLFNDWEGPGRLVVRDGRSLLAINGSVVPSNEAWFLRIVAATAEEHEKLQEAGYVLKEV